MKLRSKQARPISGLLALARVKGFRCALLLFFVFLLLSLLPPSIPALESKLDPRTQVALTVFPRILASDRDLEDKLNEKGALLVLVYYERDRGNSQAISDYLVENVPLIKTHPVEVMLGNTIGTLAAVKPSAIILAERLENSSFAQVMEIGMNEGLIVFSFSPRDVERGATASLNITSRIRPYFNRNTLERSGIRILNELLEVSLIYE